MHDVYIFLVGVLKAREQKTVERFTWASKRFIINHNDGASCTNEISNEIVDEKCRQICEYSFWWKLRLFIIVCFSWRRWLGRKEAGGTEFFYSDNDGLVQHYTERFVRLKFRQRNGLFVGVWTFLNVYCNEFRKTRDFWFVFFFFLFNGRLRTIIEYEKMSFPTVGQTQSSS